LLVALRCFSTVIGYGNGFLRRDGIASVTCCDLTAGVPYNGSGGDAPSSEEVNESNLDGGAKGLGEFRKVDVAGFLGFEEFILRVVSEARASEKLCG
jgi:hypothetical protein